MDLDLTYDKKITDAGIMHLTNLTRLIAISTTKITDHGISSLLNLRILDLSNVNNVTGTCLGYLSKLQSLWLKYNEIIQDKMLFGLNLTELNIISNNLISDNSIKSLTSLKTISFNINNNKISTECINHLSCINRI